MTGRVLRGLNWGHRRATGPLDAAAARFAQAHPGLHVEWEVQPLSGFEHGLGPAIVDRYDLVVFDHPFCGTIARDGLLHPLTGFLGGLREEDFIGRSLASYRYAGELWALPIDGATQVALYRPDLLGTASDVPRTWEQMLALGDHVRREGRWLGLACLNPHAFLVVEALCAHLGRPFAIDPWSDPFDRATLRRALDALRELIELVHPDCLRFNAIDLHEAMAARDDIVYCPIAYGYLTYAEADRARPLRFADVPILVGTEPAGTVLGGTGLGITRSCRDSPAAEALVAMLSGGEAQVGLVAMHHGQPGHIAAWDDAAVDARFGGALSGTRRTMEEAWIRPRFPGAIGLQHACGEATARFCSGEIDAAALEDRLHALWRSCMPVLRRKVGREGGPPASLSGARSREVASAG